jgi:hypothetical protein
MSGGVAAGELCPCAPVSRRLTARLAAEPQDSDPGFFHTFSSTKSFTGNAVPALKSWAKFRASLRDERRRSRRRIMPVRAGESETHRTAGGGAAGGCRV